MELNKIYCESNLETMAKMPDNFVDLTVTSPPYDNLRDYKGYSFDFENVAKELYRVTKEGGVVVWVVGDSCVDGGETGSSFRQALFFQKCGFLIHDTMIYQKTGCAMPSPNRYLANFEFMFVLSKGKPKAYNMIEDRKNRFTERWGKGRKVRNKDGTWSYRENYKAKEYGRRFNIWQYNNGGQGHGTEDNVSFHPATFPEQLAADHIYSWSNEGDLVYDPFCGSGTTPKQAHLLKRNWIGSEISPEYVELSVNRLKPYLNQLTMF